MPGDATTPTVSTESVLIAEKIDAQEGRNVGIWDTPGDFISADIYRGIKMDLHGRLAEVMVNIERQIYR